MVTEQTKFKFKGYRITKSDISIKPDGDINQKLNISFSGKNQEAENSVYILDLTTSVSNEDKSIDITIDMRGFFEFDEGLSTDNQKIFFNGNAPAIMFPYIRAAISTITGISGIAPIVLPTINFAESARRAKAKENDSK